METQEHGKPVMQLQAWQLPGGGVCCAARSRRLKGGPRDPLGVALSSFTLSSSSIPMVPSTFRLGFHLSPCPTSLLHGSTATACPESCACLIQAVLHPAQAPNHHSDSGEWELIMLFSEKNLFDKASPLLLSYFQPRPGCLSYLNL